MPTNSRRPNLTNTSYISDSWTNVSQDVIERLALVQNYTATWPQVVPPSGSSPFVSIDEDTGEPLLESDSVNDLRYSTNQEGKPLLGVELEISTYETPSVFTHNVPAPMLMAKSDSSIYAPDFTSGFELVSVPADLPHQLVLWSSVFKASKGANIYKGLDSGNGLHVHVNLAEFQGSDHHKKFAWFLNSPCPLTQKFLIDFSQRSDNSFRENCAVESVACTRFNTHSVIVNENNTDLISRWSRGGMKWCGCYSRHQTLEVRLFKGVWNFSYVLSCLQFVDALFQWTRDVSWDDLQSTTYAPDCTPMFENFQTYVVENNNNTTNKWNYLVKSLEKLRLHSDRKEDYETIKEIDKYRKGHAGRPGLGTSTRFKKTAEFLLTHMIPDSDKYEVVKGTSQDGGYYDEYDDFIETDGQPTWVITLKKDLMNDLFDFDMEETMEELEGMYSRSRVDEMTDDELDQFYDDCSSSLRLAS